MLMYDIFIIVRKQNKNLNHIKPENPHPKSSTTGNIPNMVNDSKPKKKNTIKIVISVFVVLFIIFILAVALEFTRALIYVHNFNQFQKKSYYSAYLKNANDFVNDGNGILYKFATCSIDNLKDLEYHKLKSDDGYRGPGWDQSYLHHKSPLIDSMNDTKKNMPPAYKKNFLSFVDPPSLNEAIHKRQTVVDLNSAINKLFSNNENIDFCIGFYEASGAGTYNTESVLSSFKKLNAPIGLETVKQNMISTLTELSKIHFNRIGSNPEYWAARAQMDKHVVELYNATKGKITPTPSHINSILSSLNN